MKKSDDFIKSMKKKAQSFYASLTDKENGENGIIHNQEIKQFVATAKANVTEHRNLYIPAGILLVAFASVWVFIPGKSLAKPAPHPLKVQQIAPQQEALKKALRKNNELTQQLVHKAKKLSSDDQYLKGINNMSMELNYLTLQNQLMKQRLDLVQSINTLKKSGVKNIPALSGGSFMGGGSLLGNQSPLSIGIIYMQNGIYHATLTLNDTNVTVITGSLVNKTYRVQRITETSVTLLDLHKDKIINLSMQNQMRSI